MAHPKVNANLIAELTAEMEKNGLTELQWTEGKRTIRVVRNSGVLPGPHEKPQGIPPSAPAGPAGPAPTPTAAVPGPGDVLSPMVGTVYVSAAPGADPFVQVGDTITKGQTVLIVEAMKTMNPIIAPASGTLERTLIADGEAVEYGQLLMAIV
jgi:acetyl-CoA carboxylase biotin carboxyl carrier protein